MAPAPLLPRRLRSARASCGHDVLHHEEVVPLQPEHDRAQHIDFALEAAPCLEKLLLAYPKYVTVGRLPGDNDAQRLDVVQAVSK